MLQTSHLMNTQSGVQLPQPMVPVLPHMAMSRPQRLSSSLSSPPIAFHEAMSQASGQHPPGLPQVVSAQPPGAVSPLMPSRTVYRSRSLQPQFSSPQPNSGFRQLGPLVQSTHGPSQPSWQSSPQHAPTGGSIGGQLGPLGLSPNRPVCAYADAADPVGIRVQQEWEEVSTVADGILRGPVDHILRDSERARCRLCGQSLTGNLVADQCIACNYRLVTAMDFAWAVCERFCHEKAELHKQALAKRRHLEEVRALAAQLREEMPSQVHGYVMRTINEPRDKLQKLRQELEDLHAIDGLGLGWSENNRDEAAETVAAEAIQGQIPDVLWHRFCESVDRRVARLAVQGGSPTHTRPSSPSKDGLANDKCLEAVNFGDYGLAGEIQGNHCWVDTIHAPSSSS